MEKFFDAVLVDLSKFQPDKQNRLIWGGKMSFNKNHSMIFITLLLAVGGCSSKVPQVPVAEQWTRTIENFSLSAVYPMREDVRVGDIKLTVAPNSTTNGQLPYRNIGFLNIDRAMREYYEQRPSYPTDAKIALTRDGSQPWAQPVAKNSLFEADTTDVKRLRMVALPGVKVATLFDASVSGSGLLGAFGIGGGGSASNGRTLDISLGGVEEIRAPDDLSVLRSFQSYCSTQIGEDGRLSPQNIALSIGLMTSAKKEIAKPQLAVVNHVIYARAVDYTFKSESGYAADISAVAGALSELAKLSTAQGDKAAVAPKPATGGGDNSSKASGLADLAAVARSKIIGAGVPGLSFSTVYVDSRGVTLRDVFERPLAFAVQVMTFDFDNLNPCSLKAVPPEVGRRYSISTR